MANKQQHTITLNLDFNVEKTKLNEISALIEKATSKPLNSGKGQSYFKNLSNEFKNVSKEAGGLYKQIGKPLASKNDVQKITGGLEKAFDALDNKVLSLQGNITKTFNSIGNAEALKKIRVLGNEISKMLDDYQKVTQFNSQIKSLGNKGEINKQINQANKELKPLKQKQQEGALSKAEIKRQNELLQIIDEGNRKLQEKLALQEKINATLQAYSASSAGELRGQIDDKILAQNNLTDSSLSMQDYENLKKLLLEVKLLLAGLKTAAQTSTAKGVQDWDDQTEAIERSNKQIQSFKELMSALGISISLDAVVSQFKEIVRYSYDYIKNLDAALTEISVVSNKSREEALALTDTFIALSAKTGMAIDDIAQASTIFYQQGLSDEAVEKMTEWTALFAKISNETVPEAADQLTAAINGFGFSTSQVGDVVDKMSVLAAYSAADINELATAMSKGASAAAQAGLSFDQYNAYLATMIETTREAPENIGTSLKTIMARFQQVKEAGTTDDGETDVNKVETALKSVGIQLRDSQGELRELGDVLEELGPKWNSLDRNTQAYLGTVIAGTRQQSRFISLMQNWDRALELTEASENSAGAAARMHAKAMDGLEASLNNLTNAWQKLISNIADSDFFKAIIDGLTGIVKWFGEGNSLLKIFAAALVLLNTKTILTNLHLERQKETYKNLDTTVQNIRETTRSYKEMLEQLATTESANVEIVKQETSAIQDLGLAYDNAADSARNFKEAQQGGSTSGNPNNPGDGKDKGGANKKGKSGVDELPLQQGTANTKKFTSAFSKLLGKIQMGITIATTVAMGIELMTDWIQTSSDEIRERVQDNYNDTQKTIGKQLDVIETVESNLDVYTNLSKKMNKSAAEVEQLAEAADALAKAAPNAIMGYDADGNPIISTSDAKAAATLAEANLAEAAKQQIGNIGTLGLADLREEAENNVAANSSYDTAQNVGTGVAVAGTLAAFAVTNIWNPAGWVTGIIAGIAALGAVTAGVAAGMEEAAINTEQYNLAVSEAKKIQEEYREELLQNMSYITKAQTSERIIKGTSEAQRVEMASYASGIWLEAQEKELFQKLSNKEIDEKEYQRQYQALGQKWEDALANIGEDALAAGYVKLGELTEGIGEKTYESVSQAISSILTNDMGIHPSDPLFEAMKEGFLAAAYNGVGGGIDKIIKELETRREADPANWEEYTKAIETLSSYSANEASFLGKMGLTDNARVFNGVIENSGGAIRNSIAYGDTAATYQTIDALETYKAQQEQILADTHQITDWTTVDMTRLSDEQKKLVENIRDATSAIETAWGSLPYSAHKTWSQLFDEYEKLTDRTNTAYKALHKLTSGEGLSYDDFKDFTTILDDLMNADMSVFDDSQLIEYSNALDGITASLRVENGMIHANKAAMKDITKIEKAISDVKVQQMRNTLLSRKMELETSQAIIEAEIAHLEYKIAEAEGAVNADELKQKSNESWATAYNEANKVFITNTDRTTEAMVKSYANAFVAITTKYNQMQTSILNGTATQEDLEKIAAEYKAELQKISFESYESTLNDKDIVELKANLSAAKRAWGEYEVKISDVELQLAMLDSGIRDTAEGTKDGAKAQDEYNDKLEKFLELLKHIEREQQNLSVAELFEDAKTGAAHIDALNRQLKYTQHLIGDTKELYLAYETEASKQATTIMRGFGDMMKFDKWGNYSVDMDKYNKLSAKEQEKLSEWLKVYDELVEKRDDYYNQHLDYIVDELENNQKRIDLYIKAEDELVEAIKQREQKILDNKIAAIDKEIDAIEKASEARRKAREEEQEAEELSSMQVDLQRALMDSSGASASQILEIQKQIKDKQQEMADNSFDTMVEDMQTQLEEEKEMEQKMFDERLEEMDWYWNEVDRIMSEGTDSILETMQMYLDNYNQSSELQQVELIKGWQDTFDKALTIGKAGAKDLQGVVAELQKNINGLEIDEDVLTDEAINTKFESRPKVETDTNKGSNANNTNYRPGSTSKPKKQSDDEYLITYKNKLGKTTYETVKKGEAATLWGSSAMDKHKDEGYAFAGWQDTNGKTLSGADGGTFIPTGNTVVEAKWNAYTPPYNGAFKSMAKGTKLEFKPGNGAYITGSYGDWGTSVYEGMSDPSGKDYDAVYQGNLHYDKNWPAPDGSRKGSYVAKFDFYLGNVKGLTGIYMPISWDGLGAKNPIWKYGDTKDGWFSKKKEGAYIYKKGGMVYNTGPAWLDGTSSNPEAVLNAMQTKAFLSFTDDLAALRAEGGMSANSSVVIDNISFNVESMSSVADGEKAFDAFVDKFKEIGAKQGISILGTSNRN